MFRNYNIYPGQIYYTKNNKYRIEAEVVSHKHFYIQIFICDKMYTCDKIYTGYVYYDISSKFNFKQSKLFKQKLIISNIDFDNYYNKLIITIDNDTLNLFKIN